MDEDKERNKFLSFHVGRAENRTPDYQIVEIPRVSFLGVKIPVVEIPGIEIPVVEKPVVEIPVIVIPGVKIPFWQSKYRISVVKIPGVKIPGVKMPVVKIPVMKIPGVETPVIQIPVVKITGVRMPVVNTGAEIPVIKIPEIEIPEIKIPGAEIPGVKYRTCCMTVLPTHGNKQSKIWKTLAHHHIISQAPTPSTKIPTCLCCFCRTAFVSIKKHQGNSHFLNMQTLDSKYRDNDMSGHACVPFRAISGDELQSSRK
ncbi:serum response factor-binding protein 1-like [Macrobrachium nipponense]|uniref:serum response factor-binding protein 1-like n=1 Tax=Macrobrachium nipponense TaxID=159736 RepID=UPI0030C82CA7